MAENKQYITQNHEFGAVHIAQEVLAAITLNALKEVEGFAGVAAKVNASDLKNWNKALKIVIGEDNEITIDCGIIVAYGQSVITVAKNAQESVSTAIANTTGIKPVAVNINVSGIARV